MLNGVLLYREYLNNIINEIQNYNLDELVVKDIATIVATGKEIEDLSYISEVFKNVGYDYSFIKNKNHIDTEVKIRSRVAEKEGFKELLEFFLPEELVDIEDSLINNIEGFDGDVEQLKSIDLDNISMGDLEEDRGLSKINNYIDEIAGLYKSVLIDNKDKVTSLIEETDKSHSKIEEEKEVKETTEPQEVSFNEESSEEILFEDIEDEDDIGDFAIWEDKDIFNMFEEIEGSSDEGVDYFSQKEIEEFNDSGFEIQVDPEIDNIEEDNILGIKIEKGKKLIDNKNVTEIDDMLAKAVILTTSKIIKTPKKTSDKIKNVDVKKLIEGLIVEEENEETEGLLCFLVEVK